MNTDILTIDTYNENSAKLLPFAEIIKAGELVAFPTETVYGLGADATNADAVKKIFAVKNRPANNPLIAHICDVSMLDTIAKNIPEEFETLFNAFWPGALTVVVDKKNIIPDVVSAGGSTVAVRCPSHPIANSLIKLSNVPIVAPSANLSTKPSPTRFEHVYDDLNGKIAGIIDGGECEIGIESTVITRIGHNAVKILRPGAITEKMLIEKGFDVTIDEHVLSAVANGETVASPGMLHKHYAPKAQMILVRGDDANVIDYINKAVSSENDAGVLCFEGEQKFFGSSICISYGNPKNPSSLSHNLFNALREFDKTNVKKIYARVIAPEGIGLGLYNRMLRAANFNVTAV